MTKPPDNVARAAGFIAARLGSEGLGAGTLASLRRLDAQALPDVSSPALQRLLAEVERHLGEERPDAREAHARGLLAHALALAGGAAGGTSLGTALHAAGFSEARLAKLLAARPAETPDAVARVARFLTARGQQVPALPLLRFIREALRGDGERERTRIARDYYRAHSAMDEKEAA